MRTTYIKPNSHTQRQARKLIDVVREICRQSGLTLDEWRLLVFEMGCEYAEIMAPTPEYAFRQLTDAHEGYWAWWMRLWIQDDYNLLRFNFKLSDGRYIYQKRDFIKTFSK